MTIKKMKIRHPKALGEWAELRFMARVAELGLHLAKPWGDNAPYDLATEHRGYFLRVQVKCTTQKRDNCYYCGLEGHHVPYRRDQIDFLAIYVIPTDTWYIIPIGAILGQRQIVLWPHVEKSKHFKYEEAWHLLKR
jgi:hypothetical protein